MGSSVMGWARRHAALDALPLSPAASSLDLRVELASAQADELDRTGKPLPPRLDELRQNVLSLQHDFELLKVLSSSGPFARVELVRTAVDNRVCDSTKLYVVKTLERRWAFRLAKQQSPREELNILRLSLSSSSPAPPIPKLIASFLTPTHFHIVLSHAAGGDLWTLLEQQNGTGLQEHIVRYWMAETVEAIEWLHAAGWAHRDIKPHNLLLNSSGHLLLTDFGSAAPLSSDGSITLRWARALVGTPDYIPPEVLLAAERVAEDTSFDEGSKAVVGEEGRAYGVEVDWWSLGVVLYETPFFAESLGETYERIINSAETLASLPNDIPYAAQELVKRLLVNATDRLSLSEIKQHPWFSKVPWGNLHSTPSPFIPPPLVVPTSRPPDPCLEKDGSAKLFDFSAFFSSPGLSVLRPSPQTGEAARLEEAKYWEGMTTVPAASAFEEGADHLFERPTMRPGPLLRQASRPFETPLPAPRPKPSLSSDQQQQPTSSGRAKRLVSDMEAWKEMQEHAWEVGTTVRKKGRRPPPEGLKLDGLEQRQKRVMRELDGIDEKYAHLFTLASGIGH